MSEAVGSGTPERLAYAGRQAGEAHGGHRQEGEPLGDEPARERVGGFLSSFLLFPPNLLRLK